MQARSTVFWGVFYLRNLDKKNYINNKKSNKTKKFDIPKSIEINSYKLKYRIFEKCCGKKCGTSAPDATCRGPIYNGLVCSRSNSLHDLF